MSPSSNSTPKNHGTVVRAWDDRFYAFVELEDKSQTVYAGFKDIIGEQGQRLEIGDLLEFITVPAAKGPRAIRIKILHKASKASTISGHSPVYPSLKKLFDSVSKPQEKPQYDERVEKEVVAISKILKANSHKLPEQRNPTILICGKAGAGKSTTINTLFMKKISKIGHTSRGTDKEKVFEWVAKGENINIVDLPGLGDTPEHDKDFEQRYKKYAKIADGFIVVVTPPRPAEIGTIKTVNLLLGCGIPSSKIIFGYNKLSQLKYDSKDGTTVRQVEVDSILGLIPEHKLIVEEAMNDFFLHLKDAIPRAKFTKSQIVEFDSLSGWNLHKMLRRVVEIMPNESLASLGKITRDAHSRKRERDLENLSKELLQFEKKEKALKELEYHLDEKSKDVLKKKEEYQKKRARVRIAEEQLAESEKNLQSQKDEGQRLLDQREKDLFKREQELQNKILDTQLQQLKNDLNKTKEEIEKKIEGMKEEDTLKDKIEKTITEKIVEVAKEAVGAVIDYGKKVLGFAVRKLLGLP